MAAEGDSALLPIIAVHFHCSTMTILGEGNLQHRRCPELHSLGPIVSFPGKGGAMLVLWLVEDLVPGLAGLVLVLALAGTAPAAARVAKARAKTTLNCILLFFAVIPNTEYRGFFV